MKRGNIWWTSFEPSIGGEIKKTRPAIIISNNTSNLVLNRVQVISLTNKIGKLYPCETIVEVNGTKGKAMADQIATVSKRRLIKKISEISDEEMESIDEIIKLQLSL